MFAADGTHVGRIDRMDGEWLTVRGGGHTYRVPRAAVAYERDNRVFLMASNRAAADLWRVDVRNATGLRGWWERRVLGPSDKRPGGRLND